MPVVQDIKREHRLRLLDGSGEKPSKRKLYVLGRRSKAAAELNHESVESVDVANDKKTPIVGCSSIRARLAEMSQTQRQTQRSKLSAFKVGTVPLKNAMEWCAPVIGGQAIPTYQACIEAVFASE